MYFYLHDIGCSLGPIEEPNVIQGFFINVEYFPYAKMGSVLVMAGSKTKKNKYFVLKDFPTSPTFLHFLFTRGFSYDFNVFADEVCSLKNHSFENWQ